MDGHGAVKLILWYFHMKLCEFQYRGIYYLHLHFTTDYTCMIVYVTNNKEPWTLEPWFMYLTKRTMLFLEIPWCAMQIPYRLISVPLY